MPREDFIALRYGASWEWESANPTLGVAEPGVEVDTHKMKVGDGMQPWAVLPYVDGTQVVAVPHAEWPPVNPLPNVLYLHLAS